MAELADGVPPGSYGLITLPYLAGERSPINDPNAKGLIFGLTLQHTRAHLYRSALEGVGYSVGQILDVIREHGVAPDRIMAIGGGAQNDLLNRMTADAVGIPVVAGPAEATALGNIMVQARAAGVVSSLAEMRRYIGRSIETKTYQPKK